MPVVSCILHHLDVKFVKMYMYVGAFWLELFRFFLPWNKYNKLTDNGLALGLSETIIFSITRLI